MDQNGSKKESNSKIQSKKGYIYSIVMTMVMIISVVVISLYEKNYADNIQT
jgi:hypothetical protein